jgi:hypothetical protein
MITFLGDYQSRPTEVEYLKHYNTIKYDCNSDFRFYLSLEHVSVVVDFKETRVIFRIYDIVEQTFYYFETDDCKAFEKTLNLTKSMKEFNAD